MYIPGLALLLVLGLSSPTTAKRAFFDDDNSVLPRVVGTVTVLDQRGLATIETKDGERYEVVAGTGWRVGDIVQCERSDREGGMPLWKRFNCRKG